MVDFVYRGRLSRRARAFWKVSFAFLIVLIFVTFFSTDDFDVGNQFDRNQFQNFFMKNEIEKSWITEKEKNFADDESSSTVLTSVSSKVLSTFESETSAKPTNHTHGFIKPVNVFGVENPGELGVPVTMPENIPPDIQKLVDDGWEKHSFNLYLSDCISLERSLPDFRTEYCKKMATKYRNNLPATSVIIIFHNEGWSTLLRSVHSVINRSPAHLLTEIILVDDSSEFGMKKEN